jgi:hypothetical protein
MVIKNIDEKNCASAIIIILQLKKYLIYIYLEYIGVVYRTIIISNKKTLIIDAVWIWYGFTVNNLLSSILEQIKNRKKPY